MTQPPATDASQPHAHSHSSSQSDFWTHALQAAEQLEHPPPLSPARVPQVTHHSLVSPDTSDIEHEDTDANTATGAASCLFNAPLTGTSGYKSLVSPNTSDIDHDSAMSADEGNHDDRVPSVVRGRDADGPDRDGLSSSTRRPAVHFLEPKPGSSDDAMSLPPSSPPAPPPIAAVTTELSYLPQQSDASGAHAYLARPEYAGNAFGDIATYMRNKDVKVQTQNAEIAAAAAALGLSPIFAGLTFYINGNTSPPMEVLRRMVLQRGGTVVPFVRRKTEIDYVIAPVLTMAKFREWQNMRIVTEVFVTASCDANKLVDWRRYRLRPPGEAKTDLFAPKTKDDSVSRVDPLNPFQTPASRTTASQEKSTPAPTVKSIARPRSPPVAATQSLLKSLGGRSTPRPPEAKSAVISHTKPVAATQSLLQPLVSGATPRLSQTRPGDHPTDVTPTPSVREDETTPVAAPRANETVGTPTISRKPSTTTRATPAHGRGEGAWDNYFMYESNKAAAELMKSDAFRAQHTAERGNDAGYIDQYYQNSRLHHLSTWKAELRVLVAEARAAAITHVPTVLAPPGEERVYFHVDFDAFFVSAGLASRPHLRGRPVAVCHSSRGGKTSTSEVASASYEARAKGVKNGMSLGRARQLCPEIETIPYEFEVYKRHSAQFYTVLLGYADELEAVSVDEALLDVTGAVRARTLAPPEAGTSSDDPAVQLAEKIRDDIRAATGCEVSIGIAPNILLARLATKRAKPAGVFHLTVDAAPEYLAKLDVDQLPSIGYSLRAKITDAFGSTSCGDLISQSKSALQRVLGPKIGETVYAFLRGQDSRRLEPDKERRSVSAEMNYGIRFRNSDQAEKYVRDLAAEVAKRLRSIGAKGRHMTLKIMVRHPDAPIEPPKFLGHGRCETINKGGPLRALTDQDTVIGDEAVRFLQSMRLDPTELRGVGIMITKLVIGPGKGQSRLDFARRKPESESRSDTEVPPGFEPSPDDLDDGAVASEAEGVADAVIDEQPSRELASTSLLNTRLVPSKAAPLGPSGPAEEPLPPTQIDPEFLAALPPTLRREVEEDHAARKRRRPTAEAQTCLEVQRDAKRQQRHPAAHITRQLRPKLKTQMGAKDIAQGALYGAWSRANGSPQPGPSRMVDTVGAHDHASSTVDSDSDIEVLGASPSKVCGVPTAELRALGVDPDVFAALPPDMQREVLDGERDRLRRQKERNRRANTNGNATRSRNGSRQNSRAPEAPVVRVSVPVRPALFGARSTDDVCSVLTRWVSSRPVPADQDAQRVASYLVKCMRGIGGIEHVSALLRCVRGLLRDAEIHKNRGEDVELDVPAWWAAWEGMKAVVDAEMSHRFGTGLRLD